MYLSGYLHSTLRERDLRFFSNRMEYERADNFYFAAEPKMFPFASETKGKLLA